MNQIICPRCKSVFIAEEYRSHECPNDFVDTKTIPIRTVFESIIDENGDKIIMVDGEDGILYTLVQCPHKIPHNLK